MSAPPFWFVVCTLSVGGGLLAGSLIHDDPVAAIGAAVGLNLILTSFLGALWRIGGDE